MSNGHCKLPDRSPLTMVSDTPRQNPCKKITTMGKTVEISVSQFSDYGRSPRGAANNAARLDMVINPVTKRGCNDGSSGGGGCQPLGRSQPSAVRTHSNGAAAGARAVPPDFRGTTTAAQAPTASSSNESSKMLLKRRGFQWATRELSEEAPLKYAEAVPAESEGGVLANL